MPTCNIATSENLFEALNTLMESHGLPWNNVVGFASDSVSVMVSVDNLLIDVFYHFKYSAKRWEEFHEIRSEFEDIKPLRVLKHSTTRWLSLLRCLHRLLAQWPALYAYFDQLAEEENNDRVQRVNSNLGSLQTKLICRFVLYALQALNKFTTIF